MNKYWIEHVIEWAFDGLVSGMEHHFRYGPTVKRDRWHGNYVRFFSVFSSPRIIDVHAAPYLWAFPRGEARVVGVIEFMGNTLRSERHVALLSLLKVSDAALYSDGTCLMKLVEEPKYELMTYCRNWKKEIRTWEEIGKEDAFRIVKLAIDRLDDLVEYGRVPASAKREFVLFAKNFFLYPRTEEEVRPYIGHEKYTILKVEEVEG